MAGPARGSAVAEQRAFILRGPLAAVFLRRTHKEVAIRSLRPAARYRQLVAQQSWILQRVPQYHVASYLGVSPETLSRIRARLPGT